MIMQNSEKIAEASQKIVDILAEFEDPEVRTYVLYEVGKEYCFHCGYKELKQYGSCQCWNDE